MSCGTGPGSGHARLRRQLEEEVFRPAHEGRDRIGAEAECLPATSGAGIQPLERADGSGTLQLLRRYGRTAGWAEEPALHGTPRFRTPAGGHVAFEPGGQLEYSTRPYDRPSDLLDDLAETIGALRAAALDDGLRMLPLGIDPVRPLDDAALQLHAPRYEHMIAYLRQRSDAGPRMMLQTAALQLNVDFGSAVPLRWNVLNAAAPFLTAIFANSAIYAGRRTGHQSYRATQWRELDPLRTGAFARSDDAVDAYLAFALDAPFLFRTDRDGRYRTFGQWLELGQVSLDDWTQHLTTLYPEIRPKGYLEIRCIDALPVRWYAAPVVLVSGLTRDPAALRAADALLPEPTPHLLRRGASHGMHDPAIAATATRLAELALEGARRLDHLIDARHTDVALEFCERYTRRGRAPADEHLSAVA